MKTLAGPTFCPDEGRLDVTSTQVRSLALDPSGLMFFVTGRPSEGLVGFRDLLGTSGLLRAGARLDRPGSIASARSGELLVATPDQIKQIAGSAPVGVLAGVRSSAGRQSGGDGGPALEARFKSIKSLAADGERGVFVADEAEGPAALAIRYINRTGEPLTFFRGTPEEITVRAGQVETIAGKISQRLAAAPRTVRETIVGEFPVMAVAGERLYLALYGKTGSRATSRLFVINLGGSTINAHGVRVGPGIIRPIAGGRVGYRGDGASAKEAVFKRISGMAVDQSGNLLLADEGNHRIRKVDAGGLVSTIAGTGKPGFNQNGKPALRAKLNRPFDVKVSPDGTLYIADRGNRQLRFIDKKGTIHAAPGNGLANGWRCAASETKNSIPEPTGRPSAVAGDAAGNTYFLLANVRALFRIHASGKRVTSLQPPDAPDGIPQDIVFAHGGLYVMYSQPARLYFWNLSSKAAKRQGSSIRPGRGKEIFVGEASRGHGTRKDGAFSGTGLLAPAPNGGVFVLDLVSRAISHLDRQGKPTRVLQAHQGRSPGCCIDIGGITSDTAGNLYLSEHFSPKIWFMNRGRLPLSVHGRTVGPGQMQVVAGGGGYGLAGDEGAALQAHFSFPGELVIDRSRNLYIADPAENVVHRLDAAGRLATAVGTGTAAFNGDALRARVTAIKSPQDLAFDRCGNLLFADAGNGRIRSVSLSRDCPRPG